MKALALGAKVFELCLNVSVAALGSLSTFAPSMGQLRIALDVSLQLLSLSAICHLVRGIVTTSFLKTTEQTPTKY